MAYRWSLRQNYVFCFIKVGARQRNKNTEVIISPSPFPCVRAREERKSKDERMIKFIAGLTEWLIFPSIRHCEAITSTFSTEISFYTVVTPIFIGNIQHLQHSTRTSSVLPSKPGTSPRKAPQKTRLLSPLSGGDSFSLQNQETETLYKTLLFSAPNLRF